MPIRGGRSGGGSRGVRSGGGTRAPRTSTGSRGFRINVGNRAARTPADTPEAANSKPTGFGSLMRPRMYSNPGGIGGRWIGLVIGIIVLGICGCVGLSLVIQALGLGG